MSSGEAASEYVSECTMDFYYQFTIEAYDLINVFAYFAFYTAFQAIGVWGIVFDRAISVAKILKYSYLGFQHIFSAKGLEWFQKQNVADHFYNFKMLYGIGPNLGVLRCIMFRSVFNSFHWIHAAFFTAEWNFWFIDE